MINRLKKLLIKSGLGLKDQDYLIKLFLRLGTKERELLLIIFEGIGESLKIFIKLLKDKLFILKNGSQRLKISEKTLEYERSFLKNLNKK